MKRYLLTLALTLATILPSWSMSYEEARQQAWFLTDKMAYELNLTPEQYNRAYEINLDYLMSIRTASDCDGIYWRYRDADFRCVLFDWQYTLFSTLDYFFRPVYWVRSAWHYPVFDHYRMGYYYFDCPAIYASYRGGMWHRRSHNDRSPYYAIRIERGRGMRDHYDAGEWRSRNNRHDGGFRPDVADGRGNGGRRDDGRPDGNVGRNDRNDGHSANGGSNNRRGDNGTTSGGNRGGSTFHPSWETGQTAQGNGNTGRGNGSTEQGNKQGSVSTQFNGNQGNGSIARPITNPGSTSFGTRRGNTNKADNSVTGQTRRSTVTGSSTRTIVGTLNSGNTGTTTTRPGTTTRPSTTTGGRTNGGGRTTTTTTRPSTGSRPSTTRSTQSTTRQQRSATTTPQRSGAKQPAGGASRSSRTFGR